MSEDESLSKRGLRGVCLKFGQRESLSVSETEKEIEREKKTKSLLNRASPAPEPLGYRKVHGKP